MFGLRTSYDMGGGPNSFRPDQYEQVGVVREFRNKCRQPVWFQSIALFLNAPVQDLRPSTGIVLKGPSFFRWILELRAAKSPIKGRGGNPE